MILLKVLKIIEMLIFLKLIIDMGCGIYYIYILEFINCICFGSGGHLLSLSEFIFKKIKKVVVFENNLYKYFYQR